MERTPITPIGTYQVSNYGDIQPPRCNAHLYKYTNKPIHNQRVGVIIQGNVPLFDSFTERNPYNHLSRTTNPMTVTGKPLSDPSLELLRLLAQVGLHSQLERLCELFHLRHQN